MVIASATGGSWTSPERIATPLVEGSTTLVLTSASRWRPRLPLAALALAAGSGGCGPQPESRYVRNTNAVLDMASYRTHAPTLHGPLTLEDLLGIADRHNINVWIASQQARIQHELATRSVLAMFPSLIAGIESHGRSRFDASASRSLETGKESLEPSYSSEKRSWRSDLAFTWNLLDFGISFARARQQANYVAIAMEREHRVRQNLALDVTGAYWRAVAARDPSQAAERIHAELSIMLEKIHEEIEDKTISPLDGLRRETTMLQQQDDLRRYDQAFLKAKLELAQLIGLPPGTPFTLADVDLDARVETFQYDVEELEWEALRNRPELFEKDIERAISRDEAYIALAEMLPIPSLSWSLNYDHNRFLAFDTWNTAGVRVAWDLLAIPRQIKQHEAITLESELITKQRVAIAVAMLTQLHLSLVDYEANREEHTFTKTISQKNAALLEAVRSQAEEGKAHNGDILDHRIRHLKARAKHLSAHASLMTSVARLLNTVGRHPLHPPAEETVVVERSNEDEEVMPAHRPADEIIVVERSIEDEKVIPAHRPAEETVVPVGNKEDAHPVPDRETRERKAPVARSDESKRGSSPHRAPRNARKPGEGRVLEWRPVLAAPGPRPLQSRGRVRGWTKVRTGDRKSDPKPPRTRSIAGRRTRDTR